MTVPLVRQRCLHHPEREAASRCPQCQRFYCRECVTEHAGRLLCRDCLARGTGAGAARRSWAGFWWTAAALAGCCLIWITFYYFGATVARAYTHVEPAQGTDK